MGGWWGAERTKQRHILDGCTAVKAAGKHGEGRYAEQPLIHSRSQVAFMLADVRCQLLAGPER